VLTELISKVGFPFYDDSSVSAVRCVDHEGPVEKD